MLNIAAKPEVLFLLTLPVAAFEMLIEVAMGVTIGVRVRSQF